MDLKYSVIRSADIADRFNVSRAVVANWLRRGALTPDARTVTGTPVWFVGSLPELDEWNRSMLATNPRSFGPR